MSNWRPIETAPKDGTLILGAWFERFHTTQAGDLAPKWFMVCCRFVEWIPGSWLWEEDFSDGLSVAPTHWQPLPNPPQDTGPGEISAA